MVTVSGVTLLEYFRDRNERVWCGLSYKYLGFKFFGHLLHSFCLLFLYV